MRSKNTRVQLTLNTVIWNAVIAESEAVGFSLSEIVDRVLYDAGYGKIAKPEKDKLEMSKFKHPYPNVLKRAGNSPIPARYRLESYLRLKLTDEQIIACERQYMEVWPEAEPPDFDLDNPNP